MLPQAQHERIYFNDFRLISVRPDSSTGSELKAVEEACREASRTVEGLRVSFKRPYSVFDGAASGMLR